MTVLLFHAYNRIHTTVMVVLGLVVSMRVYTRHKLCMNYMKGDLEIPKVHARGSRYSWQVMDVQPVSPEVESPPVMDVQPVSPEVESPLSPLRHVDRQLIHEVRADAARGHSRSVVLQFLKYIFKVLIILKKAYDHMYPNPPQLSVPCNNESHWQVPGHVHINLMGGQFERLTYVGMLLRTVDKIYFLREKYGQCQDFEREVTTLRDDHPAIAHGVAVLNFLTGKLCWNDLPTLNNLFKLVEALSRCEKEHPSVQTHHYYKEGSSKCTLSVINAVLAQCKGCRHITKRRVVEQIETLQSHLQDLAIWHDCGDCESVLVDILTYTNALCTHPRIFNNSNFRMMASLRISLDYDLDVRKLKVQQNTDRAIDQLRQIQDVRRLLHDFGFAMISLTSNGFPPKDDILKVWMEYEVMFISGNQEGENSKTDLKRFLQDGLQLKARRPFFIQWKHQLLRCDPAADAHKRKGCTEPQMKITLAQVTQALQDVHSKLTVVQPFYKVDMVLEECPCGSCIKTCIPSIICEAEYHKIPLQIISMLPYHKGSEFLQRMTNEGGPMYPFEEKHVCLVDRAEPYTTIAVHP